MHSIRDCDQNSPTLTMSLAQLPPELLHRVCSYSDLPEIKSIRLTCSQLAAIGAEYLLPEVETFFLRGSIDKVEQIARSPGVARGVRTLCFQADRLEELGSFEDWYAAQGHGYPRGWPALIRLSGPHETPGHQRTLRVEYQQHRSSSLITCYEQYQCLRSDQLRLQSHDKIRKSLLLLFKACPRLDKVYITMADGLRRSTTMKLPPFEMALVDAWGDIADIDMCVDQAEATLLAAHEANAMLESLAIATIFHRFFGRPQTAEKIHHAMHNVEELRVSFYGPQNVHRDDATSPEVLNQIHKDIKDQGLVRFFVSASELRRLRIAGPPICHLDTRLSIFPLVDTVGKTIWPNLRSLCLEYISCSQTDIATLIDHHQHALEYLHLADMDMTAGGTWHRVLQDIARKLPVLRRAWLFGCCHSADHGEGRYEFLFEDAGEELQHDVRPAMQDFLVRGGRMPRFHEYGV